MKFRLAVLDDLPRIKTVYGDIVANMNQNGVEIWDDVYPCDFFENDIVKKRLYLLIDGDEIVSAFALCAEDRDYAGLNWSDGCARAVYMERFGVNVAHQRHKVGSLALKKAIDIAKHGGANYFRLLTVDKNTPAINFYLKNGFIKADGIYDEHIDANVALHEYGFEIDLRNI